MKGFIKTDAIDGWIDKREWKQLSICEKNGMAVNIPTKDWLEVVEQ